jgi:hypothetical protein
MRGASHYGCQIEWTLDKPSQREHTKSIKIYKLWSLYKFGEKIVCSSRLWVPNLVFDKLSSTSQNFGTKNHKICYHVDILEGVIHWLLNFSMKAQLLFLTNLIARTLYL